MIGRCLTCFPVVEYATVDEFGDHERMHADRSRQEFRARLDADPVLGPADDGSIKVSKADAARIGAIDDRAERHALARRLGISTGYADQLHRPSRAPRVR